MVFHSKYIWHWCSKDGQSTKSNVVPSGWPKSLLACKWASVLPESHAQKEWKGGLSEAPINEPKSFNSMMFTKAREGQYCSDPASKGWRNLSIDPKRKGEKHWSILVLPLMNCQLLVSRLDKNSTGTTLSQLAPKDLKQLFRKTEEWGTHKC